MENKKSRRDTSVYIRVTPNQKEEFTRLAEEQGHTLSSYLRHIILETLKEREVK